MKALIFAASLLIAAAPMAASAQSRHGGGHGDWHGNHGGRGGDGWRRGGEGWRGQAGPWNGGGEWRGAPIRGGDWRGDGWRGRDLRRGGYLPPAYRGYVVRDYGRWHLRRPPQGYEWYRTDDGWALAAIASGMIFDMIEQDRNGY